MDVLTLEGAGLAILISVGSLLLAIRADRRSGRAERATTSAELILVPFGGSSDGANFRHEFTIRNIGQASAHLVQAWLVDERGETVSSVETEPGITIAKDEESRMLGVSTGKHEFPSLVFVLSWRDGFGPHEQRTDVHPI